MRLCVPCMPTATILAVFMTLCWCAWVRSDVRGGWPMLWAGSSVVEPEPRCVWSVPRRCHKPASHRGGGRRRRRGVYCGSGRVLCAGTTSSPVWRGSSDGASTVGLSRSACLPGQWRRQGYNTLCPKKETNMMFMISSIKLRRFWWNLVHSFLNKFAAKSYKHFPPHLNNVSTLNSTQLNFVVTRLQLNSWTAGLLDIAQ